VTSSFLIDPVVDHLADLALWEVELAANPAAADPLAVVSPLTERLAQVPDPRRPHRFPPPSTPTGDALGRLKSGFFSSSTAG
jgi:hypothetical protein